MFHAKKLIITLALSLIAFSAYSKEDYKLPKVSVKDQASTDHYKLKKDLSDNAFDYKVEEDSIETQERSFASETPSSIGQEKSEDKIKGWKYQD